MRVNTNTRGSRAGSAPNALQQLRRSVLATLLWEDNFYEDGKTNAQRIEELSAAVSPEQLAALAVEARDKQHLRHVPLFLAVQLVKHGAGKQGLVSDTIFSVVQRADELSELVSLYWKNGKRPLSAQLKKGLAKAFTKFNAYSLAKYNRDTAIKLRDVLFMVHAKGKDAEQQAVFDQLASGTLAAPDTWEVALSAGANKKETWERLLKEGKLGYLALLRNLRNMEQAGVDRSLVRDAIQARKGAEKVLPFRYVAAARHAPSFEPALDAALIACVEGLPKLSGRTAVLVDVSGSMDCKLSGKSELTRIDAAATLASVLNAEDLQVFSFSNKLVQVPARKGMAGVEAIKKSQYHSGTALGHALRELKTYGKFDRIIIITDEQSTDGAIGSYDVKRGYIINVAGYGQSSIGYDTNWTRINGFSENVIRWIAEYEAL